MRFFSSSSLSRPRGLTRTSNAGSSSSPPAASKAGADTDPDWYRNLVANPETTAEIGTDTRAFRAGRQEIAELGRVAPKAKPTLKPFRQFLQTMDDRRRAVDNDDNRAVQGGPPAPDPTHIGRGGRRPEDLYWRIRGGIHPSGMPAVTLTEAQVWDLVHFVDALPYPRVLPEGVREKVYPPRDTGRRAAGE